MLSPAETLPFQVAGTQDIPEEQRLRYRFLDLRREKMHANIVLRSQVISSIRRRMRAQGFLEFQTPILTSSSPEGARDYLVPSRMHPGKFYALPQAPQQFKQLLMVSGFDRYFQIAPCFRDEDARADRSPGEFYQLDVELSFVTQDDVFAAIEPVLAGVFGEFSDWKSRSRRFPRIAYDDAMTMYGTDKPDLRNPIRAADVTEIFRGSEFAVFARAVEEGAVVRAIPAPGAAEKSRSFFDKTVGLANRSDSAASPTSSPRIRHAGRWRNFSATIGGARLFEAPGVKPGDAVFSRPAPARASRGPIDGLRTHLGSRARAARGQRVPVLLDHRLSVLRARCRNRAGDLQPQSVFDAARRAGRAQHQDPLSIKAFQRHRLQRRGAVERRDPEPSARHHAAGVRDCRLRPEEVRSGSAGC